MRAVSFCFPFFPHFIEAVSFEKEVRLICSSLPPCSPLHFFSPSCLLVFSTLACLFVIHWWQMYEDVSGRGTALLAFSLTGNLVCNLHPPCIFLFSDQHYSEYYSHGDYPVVKVLRDPVFLEVRILRRTDPKLVLVLHECWATPSTNPLQQPQWPILVNR